MCSGSLVDVLQSVVGGSEGCLFSYGYAGLGIIAFSASIKKEQKSFIVCRFNKYFAFAKNSFFFL